MAHDMVRFETLSHGIRRIPLCSPVAFVRAKFPARSPARLTSVLRRRKPTAMVREDMKALGRANDADVIDDLSHTF